MMIDSIRDRLFLAVQCRLGVRASHLQGPWPSGPCLPKSPKAFVGHQDLNRRRVTPTDECTRNPDDSVLHKESFGKSAVVLQRSDS
jgi:hypothetical protein